MKLLHKVLFNILMMSAVESSKPTSQEISRIFHHMREVGCCDFCAHMYSGKTNEQFYENLYSIHMKKGQTSKKNKTNPCISCLGLLHGPFREEIVDKLISDISKSENDYDSFNVALSLPVSYQMRAHSLTYYLKKNFTSVTRTHNGIFPWINIKDIFKITSAPYVAKQVKRTFKYSSDLTVNVKLSYSNDELECYKLLELCPDVFGKRYIKKFRGFLFSRKSVEEALNNKNNIKLRNYYSNVPSVPNHAIVYEGVDIKQNSMFCAGRYNKYSRKLPQSPWFIKGYRRFNTSLQELFSKDVQKLFNAQDYLFSASGREDVDVRMLGTGRPFSIELINPSRTKVTEKDLKNLEEMINRKHGKDIQVRNLQIISKNDLKQLKAGEESKMKTYEALCVSRVPLSPEVLFEVCKTAPFDIQQKTPIRVLHRRANMVRTKRIHSMEITHIQYPIKNQTFFTLKLVTQAGTYIKEFVNGDLNRTLPNMGTLLKSKDIDILALDVLKIDLDWPPKKKYEL